MGRKVRGGKLVRKLKYVEWKMRNYDNLRGSFSLEIHDGVFTDNLVIERFGEKIEKNKRQVDIDKSNL